MPANGYSIGKDAVFTVNTPTGLLRVVITSFDAKPVYTDLKSIPLNDAPVHMSVPSGWKGSFKLDRMDSSIDDYVATYEAAYWAGQNMLSGSITVTINEPDGSTSKYKFTKVNLKVTDTGSFSGEKLVDQTVEFEASKRLKV